MPKPPPTSGVTTRMRFSGDVEHVLGEQVAHGSASPGSNSTACSCPRRGRIRRSRRAAPSNWHEHGCCRGDSDTWRARAKAASAAGLVADLPVELRLSAPRPRQRLAGVERRGRCRRWRAAGSYSTTIARRRRAPRRASRRPRSPPYRRHGGRGRSPWTAATAAPSATAVAVGHGVRNGIGPMPSFASRRRYRATNARHAAASSVSTARIRAWHAASAGRGMSLSREVDVVG